MELLWQSFLYASSAPYFWLSMGMTTAVSMFIGAIIFDGNLSAATKGTIGLLSYVFFLSEVTFERVTHVLSKNPNSDPIMAYAGIITMVVITVFWLMGVILGVCISGNCRKRKHVGRG